MESGLLKRYEKNPILKPKENSTWESLMVFNTAAIYLNEKVHLLYRARAVVGGVSRIGYASSKDGFNIDERAEKPVFTPDPANDFECMGVEDPRITKIGDEIYMIYTAYGKFPGMNRAIGSIQIGLTSISVSDFLDKKWNWKKRIYPLYGVDNKDCVIFPEKIKGKFVIYHRIPPHIWIAYSDDLKNWYNHNIIMSPRQGWEYFKVGGSATPIKTEKGWLIIYHGVDSKHCYRLGLAMVDLEDPSKILFRDEKPLLEPKEKYETEGDVPNVVFSDGAIIRDGKLFVYYGGADTSINVATADLNKVLSYTKI